MYPEDSTTLQNFEIEKTGVFHVFEKWHIGNYQPEKAQSLVRRRKQHIEGKMSIIAGLVYDGKGF